MQDFDVSLLEPTTLDLFGGDSQVAADLLKVVGDDYATHDELIQARQRYELAWKVNGHEEAALYLAQLIYRRPDVVDPDGKLRASLAAMSARLMSNGSDWRVIRNFHVILGDMAEAEQDTARSLRESEFARRAHDRFTLANPGIEEPIPLLRERLARGYEAEGRDSLAIDHYLAAAEDYALLGHEEAREYAIARAAHLSEGDRNEGNDIPSWPRRPAEVVLAGGFVKVPGTAVIKKVVAASDSIYASSSKGGNDNAFRLEVLKPYFVLGEEAGFIKITDQQTKGGRIGFVPRRQVIEWNSREGLHFRPGALQFDGRPEIRVWKDRATIEQYAATGNIRSYGPSYVEDRLISRAVTKELVPYAILDSTMIPTVTGSDKRIYRVLIPAYVPTATVETDLTGGEIREILSKVTFCIVFDATGSMEPYANEMAATIETLLRRLGAQAGDIRVGFVFYRDIGDANPVEIVNAAPIDVAVKRLREMAGRMTGGGDAAEPVLDAAVIAASEFDWAGGDQTGSRRAAIIVLNYDAKPATVGLDGRVGRGQDVGEVAHLLSTKFIRVFALQAGPDDGGNLRKTLGKLANDTDGEFYTHGAGSTGLSGSFSSNIRRLMEGTMTTALGEARAVADTAIPDDRGYTVLPLKVLDSELISRLQEAAREFNITEGGLIIREGWMFEQEDLYQEQVLVEKETILQLITFFSLLADSSVSCDDLRSGVRENLEAMLGENIDDRAELQELIEKKLGVHFRTTLTGFSLEYLCGLSPRERLLLQTRIYKASI